MKIELKIDGRTFVIEAEGTVSVQVFEGKEAVCPEGAEPEAPAAGAAVPVSGDADLFAKLSELRRELAISENVPPYVVFKDSALREMAEKRPQDMAGVSAIGGVGKAKLEKYGEAFLAVICEEVRV